MNRQQNVGTADRLVRAILGLSLVLFGAAGLFPGVWRLILPAGGVVVMLTAVFSYCPLYALLGLDRPGR